MADYENFGDWQFTVDREATVSAYKEAGPGGADTCDCAPCRNFRLARAAAFTDEFLRLLQSLGIDPEKDAEVFHIGRAAPGAHLYGGWFYFVGDLHETGDFPVVQLGPGLVAFLSKSPVPKLESFAGEPIALVEFHVEGVPWLLDEPEAE